MTLRLGTRRSALALAQSGHVADAITAATGIPVELVPIVSEGDVSRASLAEIGGVGVFATRLREALLAGECDLLVHSLKDLPTAPAPGLELGAVPVREDARDVFVSRGTLLEDLAEGALVGTGSPRRIAQVHRRNPRVRVQDIRGNVDSRLERVRTGELDGIVLAAAGLSRLGVLREEKSLSFQPLGLAEWPTAAGQGALAIEIRDDAPERVRTAVAAVEDAATRLVVSVERSVLSGLEAGCHAPLGVHASLTDDTLRVRTVVYAVDGSTRIGSDETERLAGGYIRSSSDGNGAQVADGADPIAHAVLLGSAIADRLLQRGAAGLVSRESTQP